VLVGEEFVVTVKEKRCGLAVQVHTKYLIRKGVYKFAMGLQLLDGGASMEEVARAASQMRMQSGPLESA
jgi:hypothetical protein